MTLTNVYDGCFTNSSTKLTLENHLIQYLILNLEPC